MIKLYRRDLLPFWMYVSYFNKKKRKLFDLREKRVLSLSKYRILFKIRKEKSGSYWLSGRSNKYKLKQQRIWPGGEKDLLRIRMIQIQQPFVGRQLCLRIFKKKIVSPHRRVLCHSQEPS